MELNAFDVIIFIAFFAVVIGISLFKSRKEVNSEDYFLAGRGLSWWLIGISIVAANISTEQFVGMAGQGASNIGLAVSNWQLIGAVGIVIIAFTLVPRFLKAGIYTMPEYLEYRYNSTARAIMAIITVIIYVAVLLTAVLYSGGLTLRTIFGIPMIYGVWLIGIIATIYTVWGGLKAVAWADLFQGLALLIGGIVIFFIGLKACGGWEIFSSENSDKLHMILPSQHEGLPWTGVVGGMWIVMVYYCGLNQFIVQRNLAAKTLRDGQLGVIFAGGLWILIPFAIVIPGIISNTLYKPDLAIEADKDNDKVLEYYEQSKNDTFEENLVLYNIDNQWKKRFPEKAQEIENYNASVEQTAKNLNQKTETKNLIGYKHDAAFPMIIRNLIPKGFRGFMFAAIAGAVISSLASMLNSAATIFTMDVYKRMIAPNTSQKGLVSLGRVLTLLFAAGGCLLAPKLDNPEFKGVFNFIQEFQGYIWPGVVAAFLFGMLVPTAPGIAGISALISGPIIYGLFQMFARELHFLVQVAVTFQLVILIMILLTFWKPLEKPKVLPVREDIEIQTSLGVKIAGSLVVVAIAIFYIIFW